MSLPQDREITPALVGTVQNLFALGTGEAPVSVEISAYFPAPDPDAPVRPDPARITVRRYYGAPGAASSMVKDYALPVGRSWWREEIIRPGMMVDVQSDTAGVLFQINGI